jgi:arsenate reductase-like glutaredoxin family protein
MTKVRLSGRRVIGYNQKEELAHLSKLWQNKIVTHDEFMMMSDLLTPAMNITESIHARKEGRFGILRWTPKEVADGYLKMRDGKVMYLSEAIKTKGITKVDLIAWIQDKYVEVSNIIVFTNRSGKPLPKLNNLKESLSENLLAYEVDENYIKVAKRMFAIAKIKKDTETMEALLDILNSQLGSLYLVVSDLTVLQEFPSAINSSRKRLELDLMRDRFAKLFYPQFNKAIPSLKLLPVLDEVLQRETKKALEEEGLLPIPKDYLP